MRRICICGEQPVYEKVSPKLHRLACECGIVIEKELLTTVEYVWKNRTDAQFGSKTASKLMRKGKKKKDKE